MRVLARDAVAGELHEDRLGRHEGQLLVDAGADNVGIHNKTVGNVVEGQQDGISQQEHLGDVHAADGAVVERALEPLGLEGGREVGRQAGELAAQGRDALGTHGVALVGHGRAANLALLERLLHLLEVGQVADVAANALGRGAEGADSVGHAQVDLAGVGLGRNGVGRGKTGLLAEDLVELLDLVGVAVEELEEGGLGAGGALGASKLQSLADGLDVLEVHHELLDPLGSTLADGDELGLFVCQMLPGSNKKKGEDY